MNVTQSHKVQGHVTFTDSHVECIGPTELLSRRPVFSRHPITGSGVNHITFSDNRCCSHAQTINLLCQYVINHNVNHCPPSAQSEFQFIKADVDKL